MNAFAALMGAQNDITLWTSLGGGEWRYSLPHHGISYTITCDMPASTATRTNTTRRGVYYLNADGTGHRFDRDDYGVSSIQAAGSTDDDVLEDSFVLAISILRILAGLSTYGDTHPLFPFRTVSPDIRHFLSKSDAQIYHECRSMLTAYGRKMIIELARADADDQPSAPTQAEIAAHDASNPAFQWVSGIYALLDQHTYVGQTNSLYHRPREHNKVVNDIRNGTAQQRHVTQAHYATLAQRHGNARYMVIFLTGDRSEVLGPLEALTCILFSAFRGSPQYLALLDAAGVPRWDSTGLNSTPALARA